MCIPLKNSYIHHPFTGAAVALIVYPSRKQLYSSFLYFVPVSFSLCIPLENSYIHPKPPKEPKSGILCIPLENSYIHLTQWYSSTYINCVSLSKTVIFIEIMWDIVALELCIPLENSYIHLFLNRKAHHTIVYPSRKQLYSS